MRMLRGLLVAEGCKIGRRHGKTLMQRMGIQALYRRPRTTKPEPGHKVYPYLLRGLAITRPTGVGDGHYLHRYGARLRLPRRGARLVQPPRPAWRLSITMEAAFCIETLEDAWRATASRRYSTPTRARSSLARPSPARSPEWRSHQHGR